MKKGQIVRQGRRVALVTCGLLMSAWAMQSCKDDDILLTGQPSWLGNSIYERLQEDGNYTVVLKLVDELGQKDVLSHTGSKTLFAADDAAYAEWFKNNSWGVRSFEQLSAAQKRLLLNNSMVNNAYLIELMSNAKSEGDAGAPELGRTMRRETALSLYDSVYIMKPSAMPNTPAWAALKARGKSIPIFKDATTAPMIHFLPTYMEYNKISNEDLAILSNHQSNNIADAWVNGKKVIERDITCKNGYIQKVSGVIESSPNMAEVIHQHPSMSKWGELLDQFSAPYYYPRGTTEYNRIYNNEDSVYVLRYFSQRAYDVKSGSVEVNDHYDNGDPVTESLLRFDPGWNQYIDANQRNDVHNDAGAMIVPTNKALEEWWNTGGLELKNEYGVIDSLPNNTLATLINVNMLSTFSETVPSKFDHVLNDAKESLGITKEDVDSCFMACNGVVYMVNKVFPPAEFQSVLFPATAHKQSMSVIYWALTGAENANDFTAFNFQPYLLSMDSKYGVLLPTNDAMLTYLDPKSFGTGSKYLFSEDGTDSTLVDNVDVLEFYYDLTKRPNQRVQVKRYKGTVDAKGNITKDEPYSGTVAQNITNPLFESMIDGMIVVMPDKSKTIEDYVNDGCQYFKTKGGSLIRATKGADGRLQFEGGWQIQHNHRTIPVEETYVKINGVSYELEEMIPMPSEMSFYMTLRQHEEYQTFLELLENDYCDLLSPTLGKNGKYKAGLSDRNNKNMRLFDNYNYTAYVPTNASLQKLQADGILPTTHELEMGDENDEIVDSICRAEGWYEGLTTEKDMTAQRENVKTIIKGIVTDFIRYHIQDNSVALGMAMATDGDNKYESMKRNLTTGRFSPLTVISTPTQMTVTDEAGNTRNVVKQEGLYNNLCREYWFDGTRQFMASDVVVHLIDGPLFYESLKPWRQVVKESLK